MAQSIIVPDSSLSNNSTVAPISTCVPTCTIDGGTVRGTTLFHSFAQFSVVAGGEAFFNNGSVIQNIFARVTGGNPSIINGQIRTQGTANLFLINPNGISFGTGASLSINGSFLATTALGVVFPNGSTFGTNPSQDAPLLTVVAPIGLQYGVSSASAPLILNSGNLRVGGDLTLATESLTAAEINNSGSLTAGRDLSLTTGTSSSNIIRNSGSLTAGGVLGLIGGTLDLQGQLRAGLTLGIRGQSTVTIGDSAASPFQAVAGGNLSISNGLSSGKIDLSALTNPASGFAAGGDLVLRSDTSILGGASFWAGREFRIERLDGSPGNLNALRDPASGVAFTPKSVLVLSNSNVSLGDYEGQSLHILGGRSVALGSVSITAPGTSSSTIDLGNPNAFLANLSTVLLPDGSSLAIDGSARATLDVRAGIDWSALGGFQFPGNLTLGNGNSPVPIALAPSASANLTFTGNPDTALVTSGLVLLSNRFNPNAASGSLVVQGTPTSAFSITTVAGRAIVLDPRATSAPLIPLVPIQPIAPGQSPPSSPVPVRNSSTAADFNGLTLQALGTDPAPDPLPSINLVDSREPNEQISQGCEPGSGEFVVRGRGGLPASAADPQSRGSLPISWVSRGDAAQRGAVLVLPAPRSTIVEAQSIVVKTNGEIFLTAAVSATPHGPRSPLVACSQARF